MKLRKRFVRLAERTVVPLHSGREVAMTPRGEDDLVVIRGRNGECVLTVLMTEQGPVLRFESTSIELATTESVVVKCADFKVEAARSLKLEGRSIALEASLGEIRLRADDDVHIDGERVLLNSSDRPQQLSWAEFLGAASADIPARSEAKETELGGAPQLEKRSTEPSTRSNLGLVSAGEES